MTDAPDARTQRLARIAEAVGCPVEAFTDRTLVPGPLARVVELLMTFERLGEIDQERLVAFARTLAADQVRSVPSVSHEMGARD